MEKSENGTERRERMEKSENGTREGRGWKRVRTELEKVENGKE